MEIPPVSSECDRLTIIYNDHLIRVDQYIPDHFPECLLVVIGWYKYADLFAA